MKRKGWLISMVVAVAMLFSGLIAAFPMASAQAADALLAVAQYVKTSGSATCATNPASATYNGTVNINVPLSTALAGHEADMAEAARYGLYPHGLEGKNKIAYISYAVTFPKNVTIGQVTTSNTSSIINGNRIVPTVESTADRQTVNFKMYLIDVNWAGVYDAYQRDKQDPGAHTVNLRIPYTVTATTKQQAQQFEAATVTGRGSLSFYKSGWEAQLDYNVQNYKTDDASQPLASGMSDCLPDPVQKTTKWVADTGESLKNPVVGDDFQVAGTIDGYEFVSEATSGDGNTKTYTFKKKSTNPTDAIPEGTIKGTISANLSGSADGNKKNLQRRRFHCSEQKVCFLCNRHTACERPC
ncbi:hypothetical protein [Alloscardovia omnicolens]|uniref:hypothetical protein n=1 Tax=Alloscardovia omnicolens TaxID=419015 RepID=UPI00254F7605|nr:hypothetical protein [Alloscardovia omnicolens]MDK6522279.1 hypothetical protein [Alloscardovia omnicolens]